MCAVLGKDMYQPEPNQEVCRALSLSGGGSKGAYEVGVLHQLARQLNGTDAQYDVISGISVGSLNAGALSLFKKGDELNQTNFL
jgi:predicted acylesterase/phospholipase RssA